MSTTKTEEPKGAQRRLSTISRHLTGGAVAASSSVEDLHKLKKPIFNKVTEQQNKTMQFLSMLEFSEENQKIGMELLKVLPSPMKDPQLIREYPDFRTRMHRIIVNGNRFGVGTNNIYSVEMSKKYGKKWGTNVLLPFPLAKRDSLPELTWMVLINNNEDCARLARTHVKKSSLYDGTFLRDGVLSTTNNELWKLQRNHVVDSFLPYASLAKIFPISRDRSFKAVLERLPNLTNNCTKPIDIWEFFLHEAMAQLQLALLGETEEYMDETNIPLRKAFGLALSNEPDLQKRLANGRKATKYIQSYASKLVEHGMEGVHSGKMLGPEPHLDGSNIHGPLTARLASLQKIVDKNMNGGLIKDNGDALHLGRDTAATFLFAGHDTTANLMTWTTFEMARRPELQLRIQSEADDFFHRCGQNIQYHDLANLPFLTLLITETLRFWPSVPNGTFRETAFKDVIKGSNNQEVHLPAGVNIALGEWSMHMDESLWGKDVNVYNPDREFLEEELCGGKYGTNPQSHRYCPFTYNPRSCIGRNFAMMEARILLITFFHTYHVSLAEPTLKQEPNCRHHESFLGQNIGTMGPKGGMHVHLKKRHHNVITKST
jgi:cytochrome P450